MNRKRRIFLQNYKRDVTIDILRGLAVLFMVCGNLPTVLSVEPYPFWLVLYNAWAAPLFIVIAGMMVAFTTQTKGHKLKYFLARGILLIIVGALIEVIIFKSNPFMFFQILYLIGTSLPIAYLFSRLNAFSQWLTVISLFSFTPLLQEFLKYTDYVVHRLIVDGWFPIFPWLGFSLLGVNLANLRWKYKSPIMLKRNVTFLIGVTILTLGGITWWLTFYYYSWPSIGFVISAIGVILILFSIVDYKPSLIIYKPLQVLGESSLFMYILHLFLIRWIIAGIWLEVDLQTFLLIYIVMSFFMIAVAYGLRVLKAKWRSRPFIIRFLLGS
ncbi:MAG: heparan-alpha-glucosaminide N-acetyltransferase domain-containing protein [Candidatus Bathyarchaeia archaeon]